MYCCSSHPQRLPETGVLLTSTRASAASTSGPNQERTECHVAGTSTEVPLPDLSVTHNDGPKQPRLLNYPKTSFGSRMRSFTSTWYDKYPQLEYSVSKDAVYCFVCRHFCPKISNQETAFVDGLRDWKNLDSKLPKHFSSKSHSDAVAQWAALKDANTSGGVSECFSDMRRKSILRNRSALGTLIRSAVFCARQAIGLRGHR